MQQLKSALIQRQRTITIKAQLKVLLSIRAKLLGLFGSFKLFNEWFRSCRHFEIILKIIIYEIHSIHIHFETKPFCSKSYRISFNLRAHLKQVGRFFNLEYPRRASHNFRKNNFLKFVISPLGENICHSQHNICFCKRLNFQRGYLNYHNCVVLPSYSQRKNIVSICPKPSY